VEAVDVFEERHLGGAARSFIDLRCDRVECCGESIKVFLDDQVPESVKIACTHWLGEGRKQNRDEAKPNDRNPEIRSMSYMLKNLAETVRLSTTDAERIYPSAPDGPSHGTFRAFGLPDAPA
ncbi:MAG: hypothetical protein AAFR57_04335, partial [Pseudomonadota bacterium]